MSKVLITGNGFDLFHHLPTKYHHFISIMLTIEDVQYNTDVSFDELFGRTFKIKHQFEYDLIIENYNSTNIKFSLEKINKIKQLLETNFWYKHFKNICEIDTWIDFEMEIENILNQLSYFDKFDNKWDIKRNIFSDDLISFNDFELFNIIQITNRQGGFRIKEEYINERNSSINVKRILENLAKSFEGFIVIFNRYLVDIVSVFYAEIKQKSVIPFHLMNEIYTFNYTPTIESVYKVDKSKIVYLHGQINEDCQKQNLVLGVSEISEEIKVNKAYAFTKYYQKIRKRTNSSFIELPDEGKANFDETLFFVIGHSLDSSDKEYIQDLFRFLELDRTNMSKIFVFYFNSNDYDRKLENLFSIIDKSVVSNMNKIGRLNFIELTTQNIISEFSSEIKKHEFVF